MVVQFPPLWFFPIQKIPDTLTLSKLCLKCAFPVVAGPSCEKAECENIKNSCYHCNLRSHHNVVCLNPKQTSLMATFPPKLDEGLEL